MIFPQAMAKEDMSKPVITTEVRKDAKGKDVVYMFIDGIKVHEEDVTKQPLPPVVTPGEPPAFFAPPSDAGGDADGAAVGFDGALDDGEAEAGALDFLLRVVFFHAVEAAENVRQVGAGDADAVVGHPDVVEVVAVSQPISTRRPGWGFCLRAFSTRLKSTWVQ
jgi:hypothetical protein